jgi:hypothetical protein
MAQNFLTRAYTVANSVLSCQTNLNQKSMYNAFHYVQERFIIIITIILIT